MGVRVRFPQVAPDLLFLTPVLVVPAHKGGAMTKTDFVQILLQLQRQQEQGRECIPCGGKGEAEVYGPSDSVNAWG